MQACILNYKEFNTNNFFIAEEFCTNVPKNPIRILHETKLQPCFRFVPLNII